MAASKRKDLGALKWLLNPAASTFAVQRGNPLMGVPIIHCQAPPRTEEGRLRQPTSRLGSYEQLPQPQTYLHTETVSATTNMQLLRQLVLLAVMAVSTTATAKVAPDAAVDAEQSQPRTNLRGLLNKIVSNDPTQAPVRVLAATWEDGNVGDARKLRRISEKIVGGETVVMFNDRRLSIADEMESAVVNFDVRSNPNCVVSVCGEMSKWYLGSKEQCFDLRIAPKSADQLENGLIRGVSAAYSGLRPVATNLYLKFDETNFIDGSKCEYEILSGSKTVREEEIARGSQAAMA
ncbi:uncharacterized protein PITG_09724 [Phytophthora infestans T30-4]|uniref:Uncharacterized protein n=1 Tax=Phytophthora infestans (strain T30-4) TaxID=403677 RepID=D0NCN5_PHYIT|nr:uncharacterized protein PITG_09724 [Phytophthora infestans T30-4]EEY55749.1 conserved hypothetical protein [Phytophthora infestans T30-4]|eukprot:XP_002903325.1 conserved hypothetical protein [Phytophthora infestans T30-4]